MTQKSTKCYDSAKKIMSKIWCHVHFKTFKTASKRVKMKVKDTVTKLGEDQGLFARMLIVAHSRQEIDLRGSLSKYEFSIVSCAIFSSDGSMHHCPKRVI